MTASDQDKQRKMIHSIEENIAALQTLIRDCSTESVVERCLLKGVIRIPLYILPRSR